MKYILPLLILILSVDSYGATFGSDPDTTGLGLSGTGAGNAIMDSHDNQSYTASSGDEITKFSLFGEGDGGSNDSIYIGLYDRTTGDTTLIGSPHGILLTSASPSVWYDTDAVSITLTAGVVYSIAFGDEVGGVAVFKANGVDGSSTSNNTTLDATWDHFQDEGRYYAMYATYTPGGGADPQVRRRRQIILGEF